MLRSALTAGGNAFIEARSLAGWGDSVVLMGDHLGNDAAGHTLRTAINATPIVSSYLIHDQAARTPLCHILITPDGQRTILALRDDNPPFTAPPTALLHTCRLVSLTRYGPHTAAVAQYAHGAGCRVVVGDATRPNDAWVPWAEVIVTSAELMMQHTPTSDIATQMRALHHVRGAAVIVTDGPRPVRALWQEAGEQQTISVAPLAIRTVDSTGAGDVFRAAVVHGLLRNWPWPQIVEFACTEATHSVAQQM